MPSNRTPNYELSQWERTDKVQMEDFNADNAKIDAALKAEAAARAARDAALSAAVAKLGNCRIETQSYTGTGECGADHPTVINFSAMPAFFTIFGGRSMAMGFGGEGYITSLTYTSSQSYSFGGSQYGVTWNGSTMTLQTGYMESQLNASNTIYHVVAFYKMDS